MVVETICLFGANVIVVAGLALFKIFGAETWRPSLPVPVATNCTKRVGATEAFDSCIFIGGSTLTLTT